MIFTFVVPLHGLCLLEGILFSSVDLWAFTPRSKAWTSIIDCSNNTIPAEVNTLLSVQKLSFTSFVHSN